VILPGRTAKIQDKHEHKKVSKEYRCLPAACLLLLLMNKVLIVVMPRFWFDFQTGVVPSLTSSCICFHLPIPALSETFRLPKPRGHADGTASTSLRLAVYGSHVLGTHRPARAAARTHFEHLITAGANKYKEAARNK